MGFVSASVHPSASAMSTTNSHLSKQMLLKDLCEITAIQTLLLHLGFFLFFIEWEWLHFPFSNLVICSNIRVALSFTERFLFSAEDMLSWGWSLRGSWMLFFSHLFFQCHVHILSIIIIFSTSLSLWIFQPLVQLYVVIIFCCTKNRFKAQKPFRSPLLKDVTLLAASILWQIPHLLISLGQHVKSSRSAWRCLQNNKILSEINQSINQLMGT